MTEQRQNTEDSLIIGEKKGVPIYRSNPSVPDPDNISKQKKVRYGDDKQGFIFSNSTGEVLNVGGAGFYKFEEVDDTRFVKMFLDGIKMTAGLSKAGMTAFEIVYRQVQENPGEDKVMLSYMIAGELVEGLKERTYQRGIKELLDKGFLFSSPADGVYFVNIRYMFNGDRLAFVKGYQRKNRSQQRELPLEAPS